MTEISRPSVRRKSRAATPSKSAAPASAPRAAKPTPPAASRTPKSRDTAATAKTRSRRRNSERTARRGSRKGWRTAANSDPRELYELAVQSPDHEADFIDRVFRKVRGRTPTAMREDFAASFALGGEWVRRRRENRVVAIDLDPRILEWGLAHRARERTPEEMSRIELVRGDVSAHHGRPVDVVVAFNFSFFVFKRREALLRYFRNARRSLVRDGLFVIDAYGGYESWSVIEEERNLDGFTYVWDQAMVNPITNEVVNHIHFRFPDGSEIRRAFTYDWRLWTIQEIREALAEAGFRRSTVFWEGTEKRTGEGNGIFKPTDRGEPCAGWIAYIVAER